MKIRVLLVDDEEEFVKLLSERLVTRGIDVKTAYNGDDAIAILKKEDIDVVILDVLMPGKSGIDTLKDIKKLKPLVEVIMFTGHGTVENAIDGMKAGAYDYLMKPTDINVLMDKIKKAYERMVEHLEKIKKAEVKKIIITHGW